MRFSRFFAALTLATACMATPPPAALATPAADAVYLDPADPANLARVPGNPDDPALKEARPPAGANDPRCRATGAALAAGATEPVILLHGTWSNQARFQYLARELQDAGHCVWTLNFGQEPISASSLPWIYGNGEMEASAREIAAFIDHVRATTGAAKVALAGHSQAGALIKRYISGLGGEGKISRVVTAGGTNHGTTMDGLNVMLTPVLEQVPEAATLTTGTAAAQQLAGSGYMRALDAAPDTAPGVIYTVLISPDDTTSTPPEASYLRETPGASVANLDVRATCGVSDREIAHDQLTIDPAAVSLISWALRRGAGEKTPAPGTCQSQWRVVAAEGAVPTAS